MNQRHLIGSANQIGQFFASMPERDEALTGIVDHIRRFWEPRMRRALLAALDDSVLQAELSEIVRASLTAHRDSLTPAAV